MNAVTAIKDRPGVLVAACLAAVLLPTSITGAGVALPAIAEDLPGGIGPLQWVVHAYDLTFASFMLAMGCLSDIFGRRRVFVSGALVYAACALLASLSQSLVLLDLVRAVTGIAAAAVMTSAAASLAQTYSGAAGARAFGLFGTSFGIGLAFGPLLAGGLTSAFGWRWFFGTQVVIALAAVLCARSMPVAPADDRPSVDWAGTTTFVVALFAFILALVEGPQLGWTHPAVLGMYAVTVLGIVAFGVVESRQERPMFDLALLRQRAYLAVCAAPVALAFGFVTLLVFLPTYFMTVYGMSAWTAGLSMLALTVGTLVMPAVAGALVARGASARALLVLCMVLVGGGCLWLTVMTPEKLAPGDRAADADDRHRVRHLERDPRRRRRDLGAARTGGHGRGDVQHDAHRGGGRGDRGRRVDDRRVPALDPPDDGAGLGRHLGRAGQPDRRGRARGDGGERPGT